MADAEPMKKEELSDEEMRKLLKPDTSVDEVLELIKQSFGKDSTSSQIKLVRELDSYDDKNYWIEMDGTPYLAKVHNGVESRDFVQLSSQGKPEQSVIYMQNAIMEHLNSHGVSTNQPQTPTNHTTASTIPAIVHSLPVVSKDHSPCDLVVRLLGWVPGRPLESLKMMPLEALADTGRFLGNLSKTLSALPTESLTAARRFHQWDGKNTLGIKSFIPCITDERKRSMIESVLESFQTEIIDSKVSESLETGLIHGDFNDANILVNEDCLVSGVIDFGDSVESWKILDLSVAMAYAMLTVYGKKNRAISAAAALLRGYHSVRPLSEAERKCLVLLITCRLSCSATLGAYSYQQNPENHYLLLHAVPCWKTLDLIWGTDPDRRQKMREVMDRVFDQACSVTEAVDPETNVIDCSDIAFPDPSIPDPLSEIRSSAKADEEGSAKRQRTD